MMFGFCSLDFFNTDYPTVTTSQGTVRGRIRRSYHGNNFYSFCGIPFAKAPIGNLKFKAPQPPEPWDGILDGTKEGVQCPSPQYFFHYLTGYEDNCLNLNVYTRQIDNIPQLAPVMVFIHGGGFVLGSNKSDGEGPHFLMTADIVLVVINYRLGLLGFLSMEDETLDVPGNAGLKDQVMALRWVQKNISHFGGDPNNVTIVGESAGAVSVNYLMLSPLAKGLFHKAILQSGSILNPWAICKPNALIAAKALGYPETDEKTILKKMKKESLRNLIRIAADSLDLMRAGVIRRYGPVIEQRHDGAFLCEDPKVLLETGNYNKVPVIIGYNSMEGILFGMLLNMTGETLPRNLEDDIPHDFNVPRNSELEKELINTIKEYYYGSLEITEKDLKPRYRLVTDIVFIHGIVNTVKLMSQHHPVYFYRNSLDSPLNMFKKLCLSRYSIVIAALNIIVRLFGITPVRYLVSKIENKLLDDIEGPAHGDDLFYFFTTMISPKIVKGTIEDFYIQRFIRLWTNFLKYGQPRPMDPDKTDDSSIWQPVIPGTFEPVFEIGQDLKSTELVDKERYYFWEEISQYCLSSQLNNTDEKSDLINTNV